MGSQQEATTLGRKAKIKASQSQQNAEGFGKQKVAIPLAILNLNDEYTNHNCLIENQLISDRVEGNIFLLVDKKTHSLVKIMPHLQGSVPFAAYETSEQFKQVKSKQIAIAGIGGEVANQDSLKYLLPMLAEFMPVWTAHQVAEVIYPGLSKGHKFIILQDEVGVVRVCLHPEDIRKLTAQCK
jgi:hypothetical protein